MTAMFCCSKIEWSRMTSEVIDSKKAREYREKRKPTEDLRACSMCGKLCAIEIVNRYLKEEKL